LKIAHLKYLLYATAAILGMWLVSPAQKIQADAHHDGHSKIVGKGDGKHHLHTTPKGHASHAHVNNGKVKTVSVMHQNKQVAVKKYKTTKKLHALGLQPEGSPFVQADTGDTVHIFAGGTDSDASNSAELASAQISLFVGFGFFNTFTNQLVIFWFPLNVVDGGDLNAILFQPGGPPVVANNPPLNVNGNCQVGGNKEYKVNLQNNTTYTITLNTLTNGHDPYLWLLDPNGNIVAQDDDGNGFPNSKIVYTPAAAGTYTIRCGSFQNKTGGNFNLIVN
jgi:hypothetical protein